MLHGRPMGGHGRSGGEVPEESTTSRRPGNELQIITEAPSVRALRRSPAHGRGRSSGAPLSRARRHGTQGGRSGGARRWPPRSTPVKAGRSGHPSPACPRRVRGRRLRHRTKQRTLSSKDRFGPDIEKRFVSRAKESASQWRPEGLSARLRHGIADDLHRRGPNTPEGSPHASVSDDGFEAPHAFKRRVACDRERRLGTS